MKIKKKLFVAYTKNHQLENKNSLILVFKIFYLGINVKKCKIHKTDRKNNYF